MGEYSVATNNRFALTLDEDEDLYELVAKQEEEKKRKDELAAEKAAQAKVAQTKNKSKSAKSNTKRTMKANDNNTQQTNRTTNYNNRNDGMYLSWLNYYQSRARNKYYSSPCVFWSQGLLYSTLLY